MHTIQGLNWPSGFILQCLSNKTLPVVQGQFFIVKLEPLNPSLQVEPITFTMKHSTLLLIFKP